MKAIKIFILLIVLAAFCSCKGQKNVDHKETQQDFHLASELSTGFAERIWNIYQDQNDNYWFGSNGKGVFFYDGHSLTNYTTKDGLVSNTTRGIQGDHIGNIFIETPSGVSKYDPRLKSQIGQKKTFETLELIVSPSNEWKLTPTDLWFNCNGNGNEVYRYDGTSLFELKLPRKNLEKAFNTAVTGLSFKDMNSSPYSVFGIDKDKKGNLWIGTIVAGAYRYDGNDFLWIAEDELSTLPDGRVPGVRSMIEDKDGNMWLSNFISKYKITGEGATLSYEKLEAVNPSSEYFQDRIAYFNSGLSDKNGHLWMTTYSGGVWKYDGQNLSNFPIKNDYLDVLLVSIYQDNQGLFWLGTDNDGVYTFDGSAFKKFKPPSNSS